MDFFTQYLSYLGRTESPAIYNRWAALTSLGAILGRRFYLEHGNFKIFPNMYVMLMGSSGARKSTSIRVMKKLVKAAGYSTIAADRTSKEKFLMDLAGEDTPGEQKLESLLDENLFGSSPEDDREMFIMADEANDFFGINNLEFLSILGNLWDYEGAYTNRIKTGKSISIHNPTISILSANTPTNFAAAFPPEILGQGFFSRILLIHGEPNGNKIPFPTSPSAAATRVMVEALQGTLSQMQGAASLSPEAEHALASIYTRGYKAQDIRFESYANRRFTHLLKLCLIVAASRRSFVISLHDVVCANTYLSHAEHYMPRALGEFGKARNSDISDKVLRIISSAPGVVVAKDIWKNIASDLDGLQQLGSILQNLVQAERIQYVPSAGGYLPRVKAVEFDSEPFINMSLLSQEERNMKL